MKRPPRYYPALEELGQRITPSVVTSPWTYEELLGGMAETRTDVFSTMEKTPSMSTFTVPGVGEAVFEPGADGRTSVEKMNSWFSFSYNSDKRVLKLLASPARGNIEIDVTVDCGGVVMDGNKAVIPGQANSISVTVRSGEKIVTTEKFSAQESLQGTPVLIDSWENVTEPEVAFERIEFFEPEAAESLEVEEIEPSEEEESEVPEFEESESGYSGGVSLPELDGAPDEIPFEGNPDELPFEGGYEEIPAETVAEEGSVASLPPSENVTNMAEADAFFAQYEVSNTEVSATEYLFVQDAPSQAQSEVTDAVFAQEEIPSSKAKSLWAAAVGFLDFAGTTSAKEEAKTPVRRGFLRRFFGRK